MENARGGREGGGGRGRGRDGGHGGGRNQRGARGRGVLGDGGGAGFRGNGRERAGGRGGGRRGDGGQPQAARGGGGEGQPQAARGGGGGRGARQESERRPARAAGFGLIQEKIREKTPDELLLWLRADRAVKTLLSSPISGNTRAGILSAVSEAVLSIDAGIGRSNLLTELLVNLR